VEREMSEVFKILTDEHIANTIVEQLRKKGLTVERVIDVLETGTPDPQILEYAFQNGYSLLTQDEHITQHVKVRHNQNKDHCGVFIAPKSQYGTIITFIAAYHQLLEGDDEALQKEVYNQIIYIT
jgi:uncharacterized protein DUF5615